MKLSKVDAKLRGKIYLAMALLGIVLYGVYCFALEPNYYITYYDSEIGLVDPIVPEVLNFVGKLVDVAVLSALCASVIYGVYRFGAAKFVGGALLFYGIVMYKYTAEEAANWIYSGFVPPDFWLDVLYAWLKATLFVIPFVIAFLVVKGIIKGYKRRAEILKKAGVEKAPLPFSGFFDFSNCLLASALTFAAVILFITFGGQLFFDVLTLQSVTNLPLMIFDYLSHIVLAVLSYFAMILVMSLLGDKLGADVVKIEK